MYDVVASRQNRFMPYLMNTLTTGVTGRQHLRSATQRKLVELRYRLNGLGRQRFAVAGP